MRCRLAAFAAGVILFAGCGDNTDPPSNIEPTAVFTSECDPRACLFTNLSTDSDGDLEAYDWDFGDGSAHVATWDAAHAYAATGEYPVTLTVTDDDGGTAATTVEVAVTEVTSPVNQPPTAKFTVTCADLACSFTNQSVDPDAGGYVKMYDWDFGDGSAHTDTYHSAHAYEEPGEYTVTLKVWDNRAASGSTTSTAIARLPNVPPTAGFVWLCTGLTCEFRDRSTDTDGSVITHWWKLGDGTFSSTLNATHTFPSPGYYQVELHIIDDRAGVGSLSWLLRFPAPEFTVSCESVTCTFEAVGGTAGLFVGWNFGDGTVSSEPTPTHRFEVTEPTTFMVTMSLGNEFFETESNSRDVSVTP